MDRNIKNKLFAPSDFSPGEVEWDVFDIDPKLPLLPQMDEFTRDLMLIRFPNACLLDVEWNCNIFEDRRFIVSLVQASSSCEWEPFEQRECRSILELRQCVKDMVETARRRPSIPMHVAPRVGLQTVFDELILDHVKPLSEQTDRLRERMLEAILGHDQVMRIGWLPPHDPTGEFVVRLLHYPGRLEDELERRKPGGRLLSERRCQTIVELKKAVGELSGEE